MGVFFIGIKTILRVVQFLLTVALIGGGLVAVTYVVSQMIQFVGDAVGVEVGSLWDWLKERMPWRRKKDKPKVK